MIQITKIFEISGGVAPYSYIITPNKSCISASEDFDPLVGTTNGTIEVLFIGDASCFAGGATLLNLTVDDANGCRVSQNNIAIVNPCQELGVRLNYSGYFQGGLRLSAFPIQQTKPPYSFRWIFDASVLQTTGSGNFRIFSPVNVNQAPQSSQITVEITDGFGCKATASTFLAFAPPTSSPINVSSLCEPGQGSRITPPIQISFPQLFPWVAWNTINFILPQGVTLINEFTDTSNPSHSRFFQFRVPSNVAPGNLVIEYNVNNVLGVPLESNGIINVEVPECISGSVINILDVTYLYDCAGKDQPVLFYAESLILSTAPIDWTTFEFVEGGNQTASGIGLNAQVTTPFGMASIDANKNIEFSLSNSNSNGVDQLMWTVKDINGIQAEIGNIFIAFDCITPPVTSDGAFDAICGQPIVLDISTLTTGNYVDYSTLEITDSPLIGSVVNNSNGTVTFYPASNIAGQFTFDFRVANGQGSFSNISTVTINQGCAGINSTVYSCVDLV